VFHLALHGVQLSKSRIAALRPAVLLNFTVLVDNASAVHLSVSLQITHQFLHHGVHDENGSTGFCGACQQLFAVYPAIPAFVGPLAVPTPTGIRFGVDHRCQFIAKPAPSPEVTEFLALVLLWGAPDFRNLPHVLRKHGVGVNRKLRVTVTDIVDGVIERRPDLTAEFLVGLDLESPVRGVVIALDDGGVAVRPRHYGRSPE